MKTVLVFDFGTTCLKAAFSDKQGKLTSVTSVSAPALKYDGLICEGDGLAYFQKAASLLHPLFRGRTEELTTGANVIIIVIKQFGSKPDFYYLPIIPALSLSLYLSIIMI